MPSIPIKTVLDYQMVELPGDPDGAYVLLLHGFGADFYDLIPMAGLYKKKPKPTWIFPNGPLEIPIGPNWIGKGWFPLDIDLIQNAIQTHSFEHISEAFSSSIEDARKKIERLVDEMKIPRSKLIIGGFSQGAVLATDFALYSPIKCAGLLIFSGTLANEKNWSRLSHMQSGMPFFQCHGIDDPLLPYEKAKELEILLKEGGCEGNLIAFSGGHEIPPSIMTDLRHFLEKILDK